MSDDTTAVAVQETQQVATLIAADAKVATREQYGLVLAAVKAVKARIKRIGDHYSPLKAKAHASWKAICNQENDDLKPCQDAEKAAKRWMDTYDDEQERKAREEQARLRREQEKREQAARAEADRLAAEAARLEAEGKAKAAARAKAAAVEQERKAEAVAAAPVAVVEAPKASGTTQREVFGFYEIEDLSLVPRDWLIPDHEKLVRYARAMRADAKVLGVRFYSQKQRAVSA